MTTPLTMPTCAVPFLTGHAYPMCSDLATEPAPLLAQVPLLPAGLHWRPLAEVKGPHTPLNVENVALLLYASFLDPMAADDHAVIAACHAELGASHGDTRHACTVYALDAEMQPEPSAARLRACKVRAAMLLKVDR
jgi:hypothetical protein